MAFAALDALREAYEVHPVTDAIGGASPEAHRAGPDRVIQAAGQPISWVSLVGELLLRCARLRRRRLMATEATSKPHVRLSERLALPRPVSFWVTAAMLVLFLYASAAPTPLYRVYQAKWGFSAATLTAVFAIYVLFVLATLLIFGSLPDHIGRRPLILAAIAVDVAACVLFLLARGPGLLFAARALEGIAVGAMSSTLGAVLQDLRPRGGLAPLLSSNAPNAGLALGVLATAVLVQYGPAPTQLVWWLLLGAFAVALVLVAVMPETGSRRPGALASLRPHVAVPRPARGAFARAVPAIVAGWALGGFYLSLGPTLTAQLTGSANLLWGGAVAFLLTGVGAATAFAARDLPAPAQMLGGCLALVAGAGVTIAAIGTGTAAVLLLGTGVAGLGYGTAFLGAYRTVVARADPSDRAGLIAAIFSVSYLAMGLPTLMAGITTAHFGLHGTALAYSAAVAGLAAAAAGTVVATGSSRTGPPPQPAAAASDLCPVPCTVPPHVPSAHQEAEPAKAPR
jgi:MFS family permease